MQPFNPELLAMARLARGFTQGSLADAVKTTQGRISKVENGLLVPPDELVESIAKVLDFPVAFFHQQGHMYGLPVRYHRKRASLGAKTLERIHAEVSILTLHVAKLLKSADLHADYDLPTIDIDDRDGDVEDVARAIRAAWDLPRGPIANLVQVIERAGVVVIPFDFGVPEVDAIGQRIRGMPPLMFVNQAIPTDRLRFTIAHELGHLVMHTFPNQDMEKEANRFAGELLMPEADIKYDLGRISLPRLAMLKPVWRVAMSAILERAKHLRKVTDREYRRLRSELTRRGYNRREPAELDLTPEEPTVVQAMIRYHQKDLGYSEPEVSEALSISTREFRRVFGDSKSRGSGIQLVS